MSVSEYTAKNLVITSWIDPGKASSKNITSTKPFKPKKSVDLLKPLRQWLDHVEVHNPKLVQTDSSPVPL